jgi:hypothetical protein
MRGGLRIGIAILAAWLAVPSARAGIYISSESRPLDDYKLNDIKKLRGILLSLALPAKPDDSDRPKYLAVLAGLEAKQKAQSLTDIERADLGGLYLRFGRPRDAVRVLTAGNSRQFLILCNLAVAYHELAVQDQDLNRFGEAVITQKRALAAWPAAWSGWSDEQWYVYRRAERLQLRLLELRLAEARQNDGKPAAWQTVDDLFPGFKMVGPSGEYEVGRTSMASLDALPPDAPWLVRELLAAYPTDFRLYWLLGEILNTVGRVEDAAQVCDDLVYGYQLTNVRTLVNHRRVLLARSKLLQDLRKSPMFEADRKSQLAPLTQEYIFWAFAPPPPPAASVGGFAAEEAGRCATAAALEELQRQERRGRPATNQPGEFTAATTATATDSLAPKMPDWRVLAVGFGVGVVFTVVAVLQRNEWKRRRQLTESRRQPVG